MFDKTVSLSSTDGSVILHIQAGTEGLKSLAIEMPPSTAVPVTPAQVMDYVAQALKAGAPGEKSKAAASPQV